jgi:hypothetical protein
MFIDMLVPKMNKYDGKLLKINGKIRNIYLLLLNKICFRIQFEETKAEIDYFVSRGLLNNNCYSIRTTEKSSKFWPGTRLELIEVESHIFPSCYKRRAHVFSDNAYVVRKLQYTTVVSVV